MVVKVDTWTEPANIHYQEMIHSTLEKIYQPKECMYLLKN